MQVALGSIQAARSRRPPETIELHGQGAREGLSISRRIAFINEKGGSAKTTLVASVAAYLALERGRKVLAIDMDPQGQLGRVFGIETRRTPRSAIELLVDAALGDPLDRPSGAQNPSHPAAPRESPGALPLVKTRIPGLHLVVANKSLALFPAWEGGDEDPTARLDAALRRAPELAEYDFVLFDAPPSFGPLTMNVLRAAEELVVPVPLTYLALDGCAELTRSVQTLRMRYGHSSLRITMVVPTFYRRTRLAHEVRAPEGALPQGDRAHGGGLPREDRRGAVPGTVHFRVRADGPSSAGHGGPGRGVRASGRERG